MSMIQLLTTDQYRALQREPIILPPPEALFEYMIETLVAKNLAQYADADPFRADLPKGLFLLIPPKPEGDILARIGGRSLVRAADLRDEFAPPAAPYLMIDIDDGCRATGGALVPEPGRSPFVVWEGVVFAAVFPMVFESHDLVLSGAQAGGATPTLCLNQGIPELRAVCYAADGFPGRGVPTCALRVGAPAPVSPLTDTSHCDLLI